MAKADTPHDDLFSRFVHSEVSGSVVLLACSLIALVWANSPYSIAYFAIEHFPIGVIWGDEYLKLSLGHWIADGLMVIFFFVVGLEIKREVAVGELSVTERAILPVSAALGGMLVPATVYLIGNFGSETAVGWGIPMATDIAFALGILALFGTRAPIGLKVFLTALAIADDLGAIVVIAVFYTSEIAFEGLVLAAAFMVLIVALARFGVRAPVVYLFCMVVVWAGVLASGIHATVAGVMLALLMPVRSQIEPRQYFERIKSGIAHLEEEGLTKESMLHDSSQAEALADVSLTAADMRPVGLTLEHVLHPVQAFLILPLFALFKAGVALDDQTLENFPTDASIGVILGLVVGKPAGVMLFAWLAVSSGRASLPEGVTWPMMLGAGALAGVGFTMSIFIGELAFSDRQVLDEVKLGILIGSLASGVFGYLVLSRALPRSGAT